MLLFLLYEILGLFSFWLFYSRTKDALNPIGIMSLSLIGVFGFTSLELYPGQPHLSPITHLVVLMAFFEIVLVGYFVLRPQTTAERCLPVVTERFSKILRISVVLVTIVAIVAIIISIGEADGFRESSLDKKGAISLGDSNKLINYGIQFIPYVALFAVFELLFKQDIERSSKLFDWGVIVGCILFSLFVLYSRGTLLVLALGSLFLVSRRWRIPLRYYVLALVLLILALSLFMLFRVDTESVIYAGTTGSPLLNMLYNYTAMNYVNLDSLIQQGDHQYTGIMYELAPIAKLFGIYNDASIVNYEIGALNAHTFLYGFYHDLGIIGVFVYTALIAFFVSYIYNLAEDERPGLILFLAVLQKAIFAVCFGDYFIAGAGLATWLPYLLTLFVSLYAFPEQKKRAKHARKASDVLKAKIKSIRS